MEQLQSLKQTFRISTSRPPILTNSDMSYRLSIYIAFLGVCLLIALVSLETTGVSAECDEGWSPWEIIYENPSPVPSPKITESVKKEKSKKRTLDEVDGEYTDKSDLPGATPFHTPWDVHTNRHTTATTTRFSANGIYQFATAKVGEKYELAYVGKSTTKNCDGIVKRYYAHVLNEKGEESKISKMKEAHCVAYRFRVCTNKPIRRDAETLETLLIEKMDAKSKLSWNKQSGSTSVDEGECAYSKEQLDLIEKFEKDQGQDELESPKKNEKSIVTSTDTKQQDEGEKKEVNDGEEEGMKIEKIEVGEMKKKDIEILDEDDDEKDAKPVKKSEKKIDQSTDTSPEGDIKMKETKEEEEEEGIDKKEKVTETKRIFKPKQEKKSGGLYSLDELHDKHPCVINRVREGEPKYKKTRSRSKTSILPTNK